MCQPAHTQNAPGVLPWPLRFGVFAKEPLGCGSKKRYQNRTLVSGNMDQDLRSPSCLILSHTHFSFSRPEELSWPLQVPHPILQRHLEVNPALRLAGDAAGRLRSAGIAPGLACFQSWVTMSLFTAIIRCILGVAWR